MNPLEALDRAHAEHAMALAEELRTARLYLRWTLGLAVVALVAVVWGMAVGR